MAISRKILFQRRIVADKSRYLNHCAVNDLNAAKERFQNSADDLSELFLCQPSVERPIYVARYLRDEG